MPIFEPARVTGPERVFSRALERSDGFAEPIGPELVGRYPHLGPHVGSLLLGNTQLHIIVQGVETFKTTGQRWVPLITAGYHKPRHRWERLQHLSSLEAWTGDDSQVVSFRQKVTPTHARIALRCQGAPFKEAILSLEITTGILTLAHLGTGFKIRLSGLQGAVTPFAGGHSGAILFEGLPLAFRSNSPLPVEIGPDSIELSSETSGQDHLLFPGAEASNQILQLGKSGAEPQQDSLQALILEGRKLPSQPRHFGVMDTEGQLLQILSITPGLSQRVLLPKTSTVAPLDAVERDPIPLANFPGGVLEPRPLARGHIDIQVSETPALVSIDAHHHFSPEAIQGAGTYLGRYHWLLSNPTTRLSLPQGTFQLVVSRTIWEPSCSFRIEAGLKLKTYTCPMGESPSEDSSKLVSLNELPADIEAPLGDAIAKVLGGGIQVRPRDTQIRVLHPSGPAVVMSPVSSAQKELWLQYRKDSAADLFDTFLAFVSQSRGESSVEILCPDKPVTFESMRQAIYSLLPDAIQAFGCPYLGLGFFDQAQALTEHDIRLTAAPTVTALNHFQNALPRAVFVRDRLPKTIPSRASLSALDDFSLSAGVDIGVFPKAGSDSVQLYVNARPGIIPETIRTVSKGVTISSVPLSAGNIREAMVDVALPKEPGIDTVRIEVVGIRQGRPNQILASTQTIRITKP